MLIPKIDFTISNEEYEKRRAELDTLDVVARLPALLQVCWHARQRDCSLALGLAHEIEAMPEVAALGLSSRTSYLGYLNLIRGEVCALRGELEAAELSAHRAIDMFDQIGDVTGKGDGLYLIVLIAFERGDRQLQNDYFDLALKEYQKENDTQRVDIVLARRLVLTAFNDAALAEQGLALTFPDTRVYSDSAATWISVVNGLIAVFTDDPGAAIKHFMLANRLALSTGQTRQAVICAANIAEVFGTLGDLDDALDWSERALTRARETNWPTTIGLGLMQTGDVLRLLKRFDEAKNYLSEALIVVSAMPGSRIYGFVLSNLGQLAVDVGDYHEALAWFMQFEDNLRAVGEPDLLLRALRGMATVLSRLKKPEDARQKAEQALELAREKMNADEQIKALCVLAELHRDHDLPPPAKMTEQTAVLHFLKAAITIGESISGYLLPAELLNDAALAYAACDDFRSAFKLSQAAMTVKADARNVEAQKRAMAMRVKQKMDLANADAEHHKKLSITLQETNATLETLAVIGQDITASLDAAAVFGSLHRHANRLLDAFTFGIYLLDPDGETLNLSFGVEGGESLFGIQWNINDPASNTSRCARERTEIVISRQTAECANPIPGTSATLSLLYAPLEAGNRLIGVMTIQSQQANAFGERERSIFRTLCAYGAIALDNAASYAATDLAKQELRVAATAFESQEAMMITDANHVIVRVNSAYTRILGRTPAEAMGRTTKSLRSKGHDDEYYAAIEHSLAMIGSWSGEYWTRRHNGEIFPLWLTIAAVRSVEGCVTHYVYSFTDITDRKQAEDEIRSLAYYDPLTKLPNRRLLTDRLRLALAKSHRTQHYGALLFIDLDNFKRLNDTRGHDVGDLLLEAVAQRLCACLREIDTVARLGGDEFVILMEGLNDSDIKAAEQVEVVANKILLSLNQPYDLAGNAHHSTPSLGACLFKGKEETIDELLKQADLAMYQAKSAGRNTFRFFNPTMQEVVAAHAALEADMRYALAHQEFLLHYQVQVDHSAKVVGVEALVRWSHRQRGVIPPMEFIPLAEETGLILPLGKWILETACAQLRCWDARPETADLSIAVNISARQFHDASFVDQVLGVLTTSAIKPHLLKLELTESLLLKDVESVIAKMNVLKAAGVSFSLDDFGTGYSSLSYLKRLPLAQLKIDQSFVRDIFEDSNDQAIVCAIVTLGKSLGLSVIAEGVETHEQRQFLEISGCNFWQGYLFGRPMPVEELNSQLMFKK